MPKLCDERKCGENTWKEKDCKRDDDLLSMEAKSSIANPGIFNCMY